MATDELIRPDEQAVAHVSMLEELLEEGENATVLKERFALYYVRLISMSGAFCTPPPGQEKRASVEGLMPMPAEVVFSMYF
ncbi:MAG TPA: hypothetical protein VFV38_08515 [Ktedonobacteraceae bacterium]|nr:hypothetical protein [Ktedonobacteraceae bacterium]